MNKLDVNGFYKVTSFLQQFDIKILGCMYWDYYFFPKF